MAKREHFFEFSWPMLIALVFALVSAWITQGPLFVSVICAVSAVGVGAYYLVWRRLQGRERSKTR